MRVFIRPHDFEVDTRRNGAPAFKATVVRIHSAGPNARLDLVAESGEPLCVEMPLDRFRACGIAPGTQVYVSPRDIKVFTGDDQNASASNGEPIRYRRAQG